MISTSRLNLIPLSHAQEQDYLHDDGRLEKGLGLNFVPGKLPPELKHTIRGFILPLFIEQPANYLFFTNWIAVEKCSLFIVADLAFKGQPDYRGISEIGYGTYALYRNRGFMTEAVYALTNWAFNERVLKTITAETDINNLASIRVLEKNGFMITQTTAGQVFWRKQEWV